MSDLTRAARRSASPLIPGVQARGRSSVADLTSLTTRRPVSRALDASLSLPGVEPEALTTAALAERARILPGAPAHPPAGGPGPGPPQRAEAERQVVAVKSTPGPRPRPRSAYPVLRSGRPGPAPGSGGEVMLRASAKRPPCGTGQAQCRVAGVKLGPQARPRQKKNSRPFFHLFPSTARAPDGSLPGGWIGSGTRPPPSPPPESPTFGRPSPAGSSPRPVNFTARGETGHPPRPSPVAGWTPRGIEHGP